MEKKTVSVLVCILIVTVVLPVAGSHNNSGYYFIYKEGITYKAKNAETGVIEKTSSDAFTVIQYGLDKLSSTGGVVELAAGTYPMTNQLNLYSGIHLKGAGKTDTILKCVSRFSYGISAVWQRDFGITDLTYDGNNRCSIPFDINGCADFYVRNVHTANPVGGSQRYWARPDLGDPWCENGELTDVSAHGAHGENQAIDFLGCRNFKLRNIEAWGSESDWGVDIHSVVNLECVNLYIHDSWGGMKVTGEGRESEKLTFTNVTIQNCIPGNGMWVVYTRDASFSNVFITGSILGNWGLLVSGYTYNLTFTESTFQNSGKYGVIKADSTQYCTFYHNNFKGPVSCVYGVSNHWDSNYYAEYTGTDSDNDGIGDTPYYLPGSGCQDNSPLMKPYGAIKSTPVEPDTIDSSTVELYHFNVLERIITRFPLLVNPLISFLIDI